MLQLDDAVDRVPGVGPRRATELRDAGILSIGDLLAYMPMRYEDRTRCTAVADLRVGDRTGIDVEVLTSRRKGPPGKRQQVEVRVSDASGEIQAVWFNQPYIASRFGTGDRVRLFGQVGHYKGGLQLVNPIVADAESADTSLHVGRPVPIYRRIGSLGPGMLRRLVAGALEVLGQTRGHLPEVVAAEHELMPLHQALGELHYPPVGADLRLWEGLRSEAHRALVMEELVNFQVVLGLQRRRADSEPGYARTIEDAVVGRIRGALPFELTRAQDRVLDEVIADLRAAAPMHRLVQGDVGCGKTAVLGAATLATCLGGEQAAILAPTEILARQHSKTLTAWGSGLGVEVVLLTAAVDLPARRDIVARLRAGAPMVVVGTHALLESAVEFKNLGFVVIDEQHRFGVGQRAALRAKGKRQGRQPDLLVTTATPIPRSLALTLYGDLEVSRIDEMPRGRRPVVTVQHSRASAGLTAKLATVAADGSRAFVVVPAIESEDDGDSTLATVESVAAALRQRLGNELVGTLHGRLDSATKNQAVEDFVSGAHPILVATTVVEVGVDVPAATLMAIVQADRFGLAQLHQLRGRVGRGSQPAECWLLADAPLSPTAARRLETLCRTHDGFEVAEQDLTLRGSGELLGYRQTGAFGFRIANPRLHSDWLLEARDVAARLLVDDEAGASQYRAELRRSWQARMRLTRAG